MKFVVKRHYNGTVGTIEFSTLEEAKKFLESDKVKADKSEGFWFQLEKVEK